MPPRSEAVTLPEVIEHNQSKASLAPRLSVGVPKETARDERRVAIVPAVVKRLVSSGLSVVVEPGAGASALIPDALFTAAGATCADEVFSCDAVLKVTAPTLAEIAQLKVGSTLIGLLSPPCPPEMLDALAAREITAFAMESIPRISRAQGMDALSSQSSLAGYKAVILAADRSTRLFPMMTTAAGTLPPAKVLVMGVGVAGLQALATAHRLGARTTGYDVRPETAEQVRSVGAEWLDTGIEAVGEGGYARELTDSEREAQQMALSKAITGFDVVITTALVPGRPAPRLISADAVRGMRAGSVIVDLAGATGGNCELTRPGQDTIESSVSILSPMNLASTVPEHASQLYARNVQALLQLLIVPDGDAQRIQPDFSDAIVAGACLTHPVDAASSTVPVSNPVPVAEAVA